MCAVELLLSLLYLIWAFVQMNPVLPCALTGIVFLFVSLRILDLAFKSSLSRRVNKRQRWLICLAALAGLLMVVLPPWRVREPMWGDEKPRIQRLDVHNAPRFRIEHYGYPPPVYKPARTSYEPIYMFLYSYHGDVVFVGIDATTSALRRKPRTPAEEFHVKYVVPQRTLSLDFVRLAAQLGILAVVTGGLFLAFNERKHRAAWRKVKTDGEDGGWVVVGSKDDYLADIERLEDKAPDPPKPARADENELPGS